MSNDERLNRWTLDVPYTENVSLRIPQARHAYMGQGREDEAASVRG
jgi:hypothetical protein